MIVKIKLNTQETDEIAEYIYNVSEYNRSPGVDCIQTLNGQIMIDSSNQEGCIEVYFDADIQENSIIWSYFIGDELKGEIYIESVELFTDSLIGIKKWE